jgi:hypothetical protein
MDFGNWNPNWETLHYEDDVNVLKIIEIDISKIPEGMMLDEFIWYHRNGINLLRG